MDILDGLNDRQQEAVTTTEGRVRVVAGAGSGKTRALAHRYAYLVNNLGIDPSNILCVTFTNKAAKEMAQRISKLVDRGHYNDYVCTIHGFCVKVLRKEIYRIGFPRTFLIIDKDDSKQLAREVMQELGIEKKDTTINAFLNNVEFNKGVLKNEYVKKYMLSGYKPSEKDKEFPFIVFLQKQLKLFALDFHDLIYFTWYILDTFDEAREYWQNELNYILVDEAQDCTNSEWYIVELLCKKYNNLFIVGDPDQLIYEWRGVALGSFMNFRHDHEVIMEENYRSTPNILDVANSVIVYNKNRIEKTLFTRHNPGKQVIHFHGNTQIEEAQWIVKQIKDIEHKLGAKNGDFAILYRASYLSRFIEEALMRDGLKYTIWGGIRFFERKEIKDSLSYIRLIALGDDLSFKRIVNVPSRKIGKVFLSRLSAIAEMEKVSLYDALKNHKNDDVFRKESVEKFIKLIEESREFSAISSISELLEYVLTGSGLKKELRDDGEEERLENIAELIDSIRYYEEVNKEEDITLETYLQDIALYTNADYKKDADTIKLMTIHQAKGLEFPFVFVIGLSEGILPNYRTIRERKKEGEEEERRLMYVAMTRAEKALFLTESEGFNVSTRTDKYPSRFIREIKKQFFVTEGSMDESLWKGTDQLIMSLEARENITESVFEEGDIVTHAIFGQGTVIEVNAERKSCKVSFENFERNILFLHLTKQTEETR